MSPLTKLDDLTEAFGEGADITEFYRFFLSREVELKHMVLSSIQGEKFANQLISDPDNFTLEVSLYFNNKGELQRD